MTRYQQMYWTVVCATFLDEGRLILTKSLWASNNISTLFPFAPLRAAVGCCLAQMWLKFAQFLTSGRTHFSTLESERSAIERLYSINLLSCLSESPQPASSHSDALLMNDVLLWTKDMLPADTFPASSS